MKKVFVALDSKIKARVILNKFLYKSKQSNFEEAKECALLHVDEILNLFVKEFEDITLHNHYVSQYRYYQEVKEELKKL